MSAPNASSDSSALDPPTVWVNGEPPPEPSVTATASAPQPALSVSPARARRWFHAYLYGALSALVLVLLLEHVVRVEGGALRLLTGAGGSTPSGAPPPPR